ncbi:hypothetical protein QBC46DRAFT_401171 [Diplogelasinospora grovesii]|uniref:Uncharacterized protein n=1 Tax=Diplogelasinospora grovesii TaxID=303347 RepID=A0AAN6MVU9_9PEZI|nr:hypothetical protein QBC46DRAFT_401171 [Diplogelasinospora grovesii]
MCQLIRRRLDCEHSIGSSWEPATANECGYAVQAGVYDMNGQLQRCTGNNSTTATFIEKGHCDNKDCRTKAYKKRGWYCHACGVAVAAVRPGQSSNRTCICGHKSCYKCSSQ